MSVFEKLNSINVNEHTEKKNGLTYLSWAWAWAEVKKAFPEANYTVYENENGWNYFTDGKTCWVKTGVTIDGLEHIEYLPVMDFRNKSISFDSVTSFDVNKAIQRSLTTAVARHGLGLYIYAGEDLPEGETESEEPKTKASAKKEQPKASGSKEEAKAAADYQLSIVNEADIEMLKAIFKKNEVSYEYVLKLYNIQSLEGISRKMYDNMMKNIKKIKEKQEASKNE